MNVFMFQNRFEALILDGVKDCTIRSPRKDGRPRANEGEKISLRVWTGLPYRSKQREFAQRTVKFTFPVRVDKRGFERPDLGGKRLVAKFMARSLGFTDWHEARKWYESAHGLPFDGVLVHFPKPVCPICSEPFDETDPGAFVSTWNGHKVLRCPKCYKREHHE